MREVFNYFRERRGSFYRRPGTVPEGGDAALKAAGKRHGPGTVAKALADLTSAGELVNRKDKKGYRLAGWLRSATPSMFD